MNKNLLYVFLMVVVLSTTLGVVSASDNMTQATQDVLAVEPNNDIELQNNAIEKDNAIQDDEILSDSNENDEALNDGNVIKTVTKGADYVELDNGYTGFCVDREATFPVAGTEYNVAQQSSLMHSKRTTESVGNKLRLAVVYYADLPEFKEKITNPYAAAAFSRTQQLIWYLTNYDDLAPYSFEYLNKDSLLKNAYFDVINRHNNGEWIDENGITIKYDDTHDVKYEFLALKSTSTYQTLFAYKKIIIDSSSNSSSSTNSSSNNNTSSNTNSSNTNSSNTNSSNKTHNDSHIIVQKHNDENNTNTQNNSNNQNNDYQESESNEHDTKNHPEKVYGVYDDDTLKQEENNHQSSSTSSVGSATGNPLIVLLITLGLLVCGSLRRKK